MDAPVMRIGAEDVPIPFGRSLDPLLVPDAPRLAKAVAALVRRR
jgi:pyruvate/2-oxoglutarate/acetoin dehydrogenase E1 component